MSIMRVWMPIIRRTGVRLLALARLAWTGMLLGSQSGLASRLVRGARLGAYRCGWSATPLSVAHDPKAVWDVVGFSAQEHRAHCICSCTGERYKRGIRFKGLAQPTESRPPPDHLERPRILIAATGHKSPSDGCQADSGI